jgi:hypothetical protein
LTSSPRLRSGRMSQTALWVCVRVCLSPSPSPPPPLLSERVLCVCVCVHMCIHTHTHTHTHTETIPGSNSHMAFENGFRRREWTRFDGNFVSKELLFDWVPPNLFVGPYPQCQDDVTKMKEAGVTGVVNVQTGMMT